MISERIDPDTPDAADAREGVTTLLGIIDSLLGENGCPWDKAQTTLTLCEYVLEEAYEFVQAVRDGKGGEIGEEGGDLLFIVFFLLRLWRDSGGDGLEYVFRSINEKMVRRHPHVFGDLQIDSREELLRNWEKIKHGEKKNGADARAEGRFHGLPVSLPALQKAYRINSKAARMGFTWGSDAEVHNQLTSEWNEFRAASESGDASAMEEEFGDYLFTLVEFGRRKGIKASQALEIANLKFLKRFSRLEEIAALEGIDLNALSMDKWNDLWDRAKNSMK